jgi:hypothetical protein
MPIPLAIFKGRANRDLDRLFAETSRALRALSAPSRLGGFSLLREKQMVAYRLLEDLQGRMRLLEDRARRKYEGRAERLLALAAHYDITLPPP